MDYFLFSLEVLLPAAVALIFYVFKKYTRFDNLGHWPKQIIYGVTFGLIAIFGTHTGIAIPGAVINARDAAVVSAGLFFGTPAGIISGLIGGLERLIVGLINPTKYGFTMIACSVSTAIAGIGAGLLRKYAFDGLRPGAISSFFIGFVFEVFHLFMVFVTNAKSYAKAFDVVKACTLPMLIGNAFGVFITIFVMNVLKYRKDYFKKPDTRKVTGRFITVLSILTFTAFTLSEVFVFKFQDKISQTQTNNLLDNAIQDIENDVSFRVDSKIKEHCYEIKDMYEDGLTPGDYNNITYTSNMQAFADLIGVTEVNIVDGNGILQYTNVDTTVYPGYIGFNFADYEQSKEFMQLLDPEFTDDVIVQEFRIMGLSEGVDENPEYRKYACVKTTFGFIEIGYNEGYLTALIGDENDGITTYRHVGENGAVVILDYSYATKSVTKDFDLNLEDGVLVNGIRENKAKTTFGVELSNGDFQVRYTYNNGYYIVSLLPDTDAFLLRDISILINTFLEIIVFGMLFMTIYVINDKLIIRRLKKTNESLEKITNGDLDEVINGGSTSEFVELAEGINSTVDALKGYIDAANKRIDEELAFAKAIQSAVLPSTFPAFPDHKEFDVHASMHPAKEVGGDFYDFYFSNSNTFYITIADVSGKGIPAALFMMRAKSILKSLSQTNMGIDKAFTEANDSLCDGNEAGMFVTAWSASIDLKKGSLTFANGGHNPPLIKHANGKFEYLKAPVNLVLAAMSGMPYKLNELQLEPGDIVYLYTDGVTEGVNTKLEQFGEERLLETLNSKEFASCKEICDYVYEKCMEFADGAAQFDDITMLAFKYNGK